MAIKKHGALRVEGRSGMYVEKMCSELIPVRGTSINIAEICSLLALLLRGTCNQLQSQVFAASTAAALGPQI